MSFAQTLAALMKERGLNQSKLAQSLGVKSQAVNQWLSGTTYPKFSHLQKLSTFFGIQLSSLIDTDDHSLNASLSLLPLVSPVAIRIAAIRRCVWPAIEQAAADLSIPLAQLEAVEAGAEQFTPAQLLRFCARAGCTEGFIVQGDMDGVRWVLVAWLGHTAPELVPGLLETAQQVRAVSGAGDDEG